MKAKFLRFFILCIILCCFYLGYLLFNSEQKSFNKDEMIDIETNSTATASIVSYIFKNFISEIKLISTELGKHKELPDDQYIEVLFSSIVENNPLVLNASYILNDGTLKTIYPKVFSKNIGHNYTFREYFQKAEKINGTVISRKIKNYPKININSVELESIVIITPVFNYKTKERIGFIASDINVNKLSETIQLDSYIKTKINKSFYLINTEYDQILCFPRQNRGVSDSLIQNNPKIKNLISNFSKSSQHSKSSLLELNGQRFFISLAKTGISETSLVVCAIEPYNKTINYKEDFFRRIRFFIIFVFAIIIIILAIILHNKSVVKKLEKHINALEIRLDKKEVKEKTYYITESDYFKELQSKIEKMKESGEYRSKQINSASKEIT